MKHDPPLTRLWDSHTHSHSETESETESDSDSVLTTDTSHSLSASVSVRLSTGSVPLSLSLRLSDWDFDFELVSLTHSVSLTDVTQWHTDSHKQTSVSYTQSHYQSQAVNHLIIVTMTMLLDITVV